MRHDVSVVGLYILDVLGRPVSRIPERGNVDFIEEIRLTVAGTAGGTVIDAAKLGLNCLAVGAVGDDEKADFVLMTMDKHGIDTSLMQRLADVPTSATILNIRPNGERPALHQRGASDHFTISAADHAQIFDARFVHLGGTGLLAKLDGEPSRAFLEAAKKAGCTTTFDLIATNEETIRIVEPLLPFIDYFMPSVEEARDLSGQSDAKDCARFFLDRGVPNVVLTMGGEGSLIAHCRRLHHHPTFAPRRGRHDRLRRRLRRRLHRRPQPGLGPRNLRPLRHSRRIARRHRPRLGRRHQELRADGGGDAAGANLNKESMAPCGSKDSSCRPCRRASKAVQWCCTRTPKAPPREISLSALKCRYEQKAIFTSGTRRYLGRS